MFGTSTLTSIMGSAPAPDAETPVIKNYARMLARHAGMHLLLIQPGTKIPADMRNKKERDADAEAGKRAGVYLATNETRVLDKYIGRYRKNAPARPSKVNPAGYGEDCEVSMAVALGPSRLVVIDADTPSEVAALKQYWMQAQGIPDEEVPHMTVSTPGQTNEAGERIHSEGGHWYFTLPEGFEIDPITVPSAIAVTVEGVGQFTIKSGSSYVLIPPTKREGRSYEMLAPDMQAPLWLLQLIRERENLNAADPQGAREERDRAAREAMDLQARLDAYDAQDVPPADQVTDTPAPLTHDQLMAAMTGVPSVEQDLADEIQAEILEEHEAQLDGDTLDEQLESWSLATSWSDILEPAGWTDSGKIDTCSCAIWTRPANEMSSSISTDRSATTHGETCTRERTDHAHPAMHIWTDHPGHQLQDLIDKAGRRTVSKFSVYAALEHDGNVAEAMKAAGVTAKMPGGGIGLSLAAVMGMAGVTPESLGIAEQMTAQDQSVPSEAPSPEQWQSPVPSVAQQDVSSVEHVEQQDVPSEVQQDDGFHLPYMDLFPPETVTTSSGRDVFAEWGISRPDAPGEDGSVDEEWRKAVPSFGSFRSFREMPPVGWLIDGVLERGGLLSLIGESGVGKSAVVLDMACTIAAGVGSWHQIACDSHPVIYVAGEGVTGAVERAKAWERANGMVGVLDDRLYIVPESVNLASHQMTWAYISHLARGLGAGLIILDTFARMSGGLEENSSKDMGAAVTRMDKVRRTSGAAVMVVHHTGRGSTHSRGSTAINGAMDSEVLLTRASKSKDPEADVYDDSGSRIEGTALKMSISKQKNGPDDTEVELVLASEDNVKSLAPYVVEDPGMVVTDVNGRPSAYTATYLSGEATRSFAPPKPEAVQDTALRVLEFVQDFKTLEVSRIAIVDGVQPDPYHEGKAKAWKTHLYRVLDLLIHQGKLERDGKSSFRVPTEDEYRDQSAGSVTA